MESSSSAPHRLSQSISAEIDLNPADSQEPREHQGGQLYEDYMIACIHHDSTLPGCCWVGAAGVCVDRSGEVGKKRHWGKGGGPGRLFVGSLWGVSCFCRDGSASGDAEDAVARGPDMALKVQE